MSISQMPLESVKLIFNTNYHEWESKETCLNLQITKFIALIPVYSAGVGNKTKSRKVSNMETQT